MSPEIIDSWKLRFRYQTHIGSYVGYRKYDFQEWEESLNIRSQNQIGPAAMHLRNLSREHVSNFLRSKMCPDRIRNYLKSYDFSAQLTDADHSKLMFQLQFEASEMFYHWVIGAPPVRLGQVLKQPMPTTPIPMEQILAIEAKREQRLVEFLGDTSPINQLLYHPMLKRVYPDILQISTVDRIYTEKNSDRFIFHERPLPPKIKNIETEFRTAVKDLITSIPTTVATAIMRHRPSWLRFGFRPPEPN